MSPALKKQKINKDNSGASKNPAKKVVVTEELSNDSDSSQDSAVSDDEMDDEVEVEDLGSEEYTSLEEEGSGTESESESESEIPKLKKKKNTDDGADSFASAFSAIIGSKLKAYDRKDPILARNKKTLKKLESDKLEAKAKRLLLNEKKQIQDKQRVKVLLPSADEPEKVKEMIENERKLKKIAQKGVVRLFNAVLSTQIKTNLEISQEKVGQSKKEELMNEISKEKFLDLVQAAGED